jgi:hypothetical protein
MDDQLSQLDQLNESDILEAFGQEPQEIKIEDIDIEPQDVENSTDLNNNDAQIEQESDTVLESKDIQEQEQEEEQEINTQQKSVSNNTSTTTTSNDLANLLSQLLNNKTIEITIKIKD